MPHELRLFLIALQYLTRVPVPAWVGFKPDWLHDSARYFPAVGLLVGGFGAFVLWAAAHAWPAPVAVLASMAATVWLTGASHEDGLAKTCDGLASAASRERALAAVKEPQRLGCIGVLGLVFVLALRAAALHGLATRDLYAALAVLPLAHAWSRAAMVLLSHGLPFGRGDAEQASKARAQRVDGFGFAVAVLWVVLAAALAATFVSATGLLAAAVAAAAVTVWMARWLHQRLGACTASGLGAAQQLAELAIYLGVLTALGHGG